MIKKISLAVFIILISCSSLKGEKIQIQPDSITQHILWYEAPAREWLEALPIGNGRLGAMVFGNPENERIQLNEDSMWPGGPDWGNSEGNIEDLKFLRHLIKEGNIEQADKEIVERFSFKRIVRSHQTMGDLFISFNDRGPIENYKRLLNLNTAEVVITYTSGGADYTQKVIASAPDDVLVIEISTNHESGMDFTLRLDRPMDEGHSTVKLSNPSPSEISMKGQVTQYGGIKHSKPAPLNYGVKFETLLKVDHKGGTVTDDNGTLNVRGVKLATLKLVANTSYYIEDFEKKNKDELSRLSGKEYKDIYDRHVRDHEKYFNRVNFQLGNQKGTNLPTDNRLEKVAKGTEDLGLVADLFQFGRYLLISSSRPGTNPANLQGIWNEHIAAPWNADYHLNINLQMNYWPAEVTNLSELHMPLFDFTDKLIDRGRITAREQYGIKRGAVVHQATDLWTPAFMRAEQPYWGSWIHGGGWLGQHYWEHYVFTGDKNFLRERAYPAIKSFAEFYLDWLVMDEKTGKWVSFPETSPENSYLNKKGKKVALTYGSAMGHQIIAEVFDNILAAAVVLEIEDDFVKEVREKRKNLFPGIVVGPDDRLLEWNEPFEEPEKGHRHLSHLYALHPGDEITQATPWAYQAAGNSIKYRLEHGGAGTGWSRAWMINFNARLLDRESAKENVNKFMQISLAKNLFDLHPPFQIDGNFGFTAGVAEMLLQSHEGFLRILPALPDTWESGKIAGLKARGDIEVDIWWENGQLKELVLKANKRRQQKIHYAGTEIIVNLPPGTEVKLNSELQIQ
jgi:alpha-L-fucosidase 2